MSLRSYAVCVVVPSVLDSPSGVTQEEVNTEVFFLHLHLLPVLTVLALIFVARKRPPLPFLRRSY